MAQSIKISDEAMAVVRKESQLSSRSIAGQVEHWMRIGRAIERSPNFSYERIREALAGLGTVESLSDEEQEVFFDDLPEALRENSDKQDEFEAYLGKGVFVGQNDDGELIYEEKW